MNDSTQNIRGTSAAEIARSIEEAIREGKLPPGSKMPTVRNLATDLDVSPGTVAASYKTLRARGLLLTRGRLGTRVAPRPPLRVPGGAGRPVPETVRNLADGNPDPALFPRLERVVSAIDWTPRLYGEAPNDPALVELATKAFHDEGIPVGPVAVVGGALDAIERILRAQLRAGDRIAVEDPAYSGILDLVRSLGLVPVPMAIDDRGPTPGSLFYALDTGAKACLITPRAQNPTGAALDEERAVELREIIDQFPETLVIEDDHAGPVSGVRAVSICRKDRPRWAITRSVAKWLGPDLRLAILTGDPGTVSRVQGRQMIGTGWVSNILQQIVVGLWKDPEVRESLRQTEQLYAGRRTAFIDALAERGIPALGRSGLNVWVPVPDESRIVQALFDRGFAVAGGERFRVDSEPAIRITTATLRPDEIETLVEALASGLTQMTNTRTG